MAKKEKRLTTCSIRYVQARTITALWRNAILTAPFAARLVFFVRRQALTERPAKNE